MTVTKTVQQPSPTLTPTAKQWWRRASLWIFIAVGLLALTIGTVLVKGAGFAAESGAILDPNSPAPTGGKALATILSEHGVEIEEVDSVDAVVDTDLTQTTLLIDDRLGALDDSDWQELRQLEVDHLVVIAPDYYGRTALEDIATIEGALLVDGETTLPAGDACPSALAERAPQVTTMRGSTYSPQAGSTGCYQGESSYAVVSGRGDGGASKVTIIGSKFMFTNDLLPQDANAAVASNVLGEHDRLLWFVPTFETEYGSSPASFVPQWLLPTTLLLLVAGTAALFAFGRRLGPLVTERLAVAVPATETLEGRARLYGQTNAHGRALDAIRLGTVRRLADLTGLGRDARVEAIADATSSLARVPRRHAHHVLLEHIPETDAEMVDLANACAELERRVRMAVGRVDTTRAAAAASRPEPDEPASINIQDRRNRA